MGNLYGSKWKLDSSNKVIVTDEADGPKVQI